MKILTQLFLKSKMYSNEISSPGRHQCLEYLKTLRNFQNDGIYTVYLGETYISESLIVGEVSSNIGKVKLPPEGLTLIHAGGIRGWVPWRYRLFFQSQELWTSPKAGGANDQIFEELCQVLRKSYGKCTLVMRSKHWVPVAGLQFQNSSDDPSLIPPRKPNFILGSASRTPLPIQMTKISCPKIARHYGHELLYLPPSYPHLSPLEAAWSSLKWAIINNRKIFTVTAFPKINDCRCIHLKALIENAIDGVTPCKWKSSFNRVKKWENRYLYSQA
ncbi:uncharacterized protein C21orf140 homolog [Narcine bancroftii]|uniref:uncharacterized protein C21orf140 homolog n=1 Tax=Narcine bancroftii TaxID=1343680 RepID=UPI003831C682